LIHRHPHLNCLQLLRLLLHLSQFRPQCRQLRKYHSRVRITQSTEKASHGKQRACGVKLRPEAALSGWAQRDRHSEEVHNTECCEEVRR
jgi:hypothetical protein